MLGTRVYSDYNPAWHPQVLVELDLSQPLPDQIAIDCGEYSHIQTIIYKHLPNSYFHCGKQGHLIRIKNPQIILSQASEKILETTPNPTTAKNGPQAQTKPTKEPGFTIVERKKSFDKPNKPQPAFKPNRYSILTYIPDPEEGEDNPDIVMSTPLDKQRIGKELDNLDSTDIDPPHNQASDKALKSYTTI